MPDFISFQAAQGGSKVRITHRALVKILPHARVDGQFGDRVAVIDVQQAAELRRVAHPQPGLDRNAAAAGGKHRVQKAVEPVRIGQKACALALGGHRARGAAQVEVDLAVSHIEQRVRRPDEVRGCAGQQLGHGGHARVCLGRDVALLARGQALVCGRGDKGHEVFVHTREIFAVRAAVDRAGHALHRGEVISHNKPSFCFRLVFIIPCRGAWRKG